MSSQSIVFEFVKSCTSGTLGLSECGPIWHFLVIAAFLVAAVVTLLILRLRARPQAEEA